MKLATINENVIAADNNAILFAEQETEIPVVTITSSQHGSVTTNRNTGSCVITLNSEQASIFTGNPDQVIIVSDLSFCRRILFTYNEVEGNALYSASYIDVADDVKIACTASYLGSSQLRLSYIKSGSLSTLNDNLGDVYAIDNNGMPKWMPLGQSDWEETDTASLNYIKHKPTIPTKLSDLASDSSHKTVTDIEKATWNSKGSYSKPGSGIPKTDLEASVQISLGKADTALQSHQDISTKAEISALSAESNARSSADAVLQSQIDAITTKSDVSDVVGTYAELQAYLKPLYKDDIVKVLTDSSHSNSLSYFKVGGTVDQPTPPYTWVYVGSEGPFYTKSESDSMLAGKQSTITSANKLPASLVSGITTSMVSGLATVASTGRYSDLSNTPVIPDITGKADKVDHATAGNMAGLDAYGNLTDSGFAVEEAETIEVVEAEALDIVTSISSSSTNKQIPTAKAVDNKFAELGNVANLTYTVISTF